VLGQKDQYAQFTRELIQVQWRPADPIDLSVIRPHAKSPPVILYLYSYPSDTSRFQDNAYCERVTNGGFAAVGFVSALTGHRYRMRPMREWFISQLQEVMASSAHDVQMTINYLSTRGDLDMNRIGILGVGSGASIAVLAAAADPRIKVLDLLDPWADWPAWLAKSSIIPEAERSTYLKGEFLNRVAPLDPLLWLPKLNSKRVRIQQIMNESNTPRSCKEHIDAATPPTARVVVYDDAFAFYTEWSGGKLCRWIKQQLRALPQ
jgi:hypothetical protein